jgi:RNA polymerase sigma factor (sigma-70 family)
MDNAIYIEGMSAHLYHALDTLSERERTIVARHYFREETFDAIASDLGITSGNARTIMNRTIKKIAEYFTNHNVEWK